jgi:threonine dehydratase
LIPPVSVTLADIQDAENRIRGIAWRTPTVPSSRYDTGDLYLKLECLQRTGSFKIRGAWNKMSRATEEEKRSGFVTVSAGNHGQAVAWCAMKLNSPCTVYVPETAVERKLESMRSMGAKIMKKPVTEIMASMADDRMYRTGMTYVPPFGDNLIVAGQGTVGLEIAREVQDIGTVIVPVGGGGLAAGIATAVKALKPSAKVYGVQAEGAAPLPQSLKSGAPVVLDSINTVADGIGANRVFDFMFPILREKLDGVFTVSDSEILQAMKHVFSEVHAVAEPAGAASLAAARKHEKEIERPVVCIISGGNVDSKLLCNTVSTPQQNT